MELGRVHGNTKSARDRFVRSSLGKQRENFQFARRQHDFAIDHRPCGRRQHYSRVGGLARSYELQAGHACEKCPKSVGELRVHDGERQPNRFCSDVFVQVAGLSAIVSATCRLSPARRSPRVTGWPTLSGPSTRSSDFTCLMGSPFHSMSMSPWWRPARAPGPFGSTLIIITPDPSLPSLVTG